MKSSRVQAGRIQQQAGADFEQGSPLVVGHPFEHFELEILETVALHGLDQGEGDFEQVVRGDTQSHRLQILGLQSFEQHPFEVGVGFQFGLVGCLRPAAQRRFDAFHFQVRPFDQADHDRLATRADALARPFVQLQLRAVRVGDVRLQRDPGRRLRPCRAGRATS